MNLKYVSAGFPPTKQQEMLREEGCWGLGWGYANPQTLFGGDLPRAVVPPRDQQEVQVCVHVCTCVISWVRMSQRNGEEREATS